MKMERRWRGDKRRSTPVRLHQLVYLSVIYDRKHLSLSANVHVIPRAVSFTFLLLFGKRKNGKS